MRDLLISITVLVGTIVGAGVLGIPYAVSKTGIFWGTLTIIILGIVLGIINLLYGEVVLRTKDNHELVGHFEKYLGKRWKEFLSFVIILYIYGALTAYCFGLGSTLANIFNGNVAVFTLGVFFIGAIIIYRGLKIVGKADLFMIFFLLIVLLASSTTALPFFEQQNLDVSETEPFFAQGVVMFAFFGITAIPLMREVLKRKKKQMKKAILWGSLIPIIVYVLFSFIVLGVVGEGFEELEGDDRIASTALANFTEGPTVLLIYTFAILSMGTSFLTLGTALKETYIFDYRFRKHLASILTLILPFVIIFWDLFISDLTNFIEIVNTAGTLGAGIICASVIFMFYNAKKWGERKPEYSIKGNLLVNGLILLVIAWGIGFFIINNIL